MALEYHPLKVAKIEPIAQDAVGLWLDIPTHLAETFVFKPGQHLSLRHTIGDKELRRFYSICSLENTNQLRIGVRHIEDGRFSGFLNQKIKPGDTLEVLAPRGRFCLQETARAKHILAFAAGSGITPIFSQLQNHLSADDDSTATLVFGNRSTKTIMLRRDLNDLKDRYLGRFETLHTLSREQQDIEFLNGHIDKALIEQLTEKSLIAPNSAAQILICGPAQMIDNVQSTLLGLGVDAEKISLERFNVAKPTGKPSKQVQKNLSEGAKISIVLDGVEQAFSISDPNDTVLSAAEKSRIELPFSCAGGMCATCRCKLIEGEVEMAQNYALEPWELEAGYVLACQSRPTTPKIRLDFDAI